MNADKLIAAIRRNGNDPHDLRDGVHEACHALDANVPKGKWKRETIHKYLMKRAGILTAGTMMFMEVRARAVEAVVCKRFNVPYALDEWARTACLEAATYGIRVEEMWMSDHVREYMTRSLVLDTVERILKLGDVS